MPPAQARGHLHRRPLRAYPAGDLPSPLEPVQPAGEILVVSLPACRAATTLHEGPYKRLPEAQVSLAEWMEAQSLHPDGPSWLIFWVTPDDVDIPAELRTELVWPVQASDTL